MQQDTVCNLSICLSDIPKDKIKTGKNGKLYLAVDVRPRKEPDAFGNDLSVSVGKTKEERAAKTDTQWIGYGQFKDFRQETPESMPAANTAAVDALGFEAQAPVATDPLPEGAATQESPDKVLPF